jgi:hypothetical protein
VKPSGQPGGLGGLAQALQSGVEGFQGQRDRQEGQRTRQFAQDAQRGTLLSKGISIDTPPEPEGFGQAFSRAMAGQPEPAVPKSPTGVAGAYNPFTKDFDKSPEIPGQLPIQRSGNASFDPNPMLQQESASLMQKGRIGNTVEAEGRQVRQGELAQALGTVKGAPLGAAVSEGASSNWLSRPPEPRGLRLGDPGYAAEMAKVAGARVAATGGAGGGGVTSMRTNALYTSAKYGYDTLEAIINGDDPATPEVESGNVRPVPSWGAQQVAKVGLGAGNVMTNEQVRQMRASGLILSDGWLRFTSGAAVPETEVERFSQGFLPMAGDDAGTLRVKSGARAVLMEAMRNAAGQGLEPGSIDPDVADSVIQAIQRVDPDAAAIGARYLRRGAPATRSGRTLHNPSDYE